MWWSSRGDLSKPNDTSAASSKPQTSTTSSKNKGTAHDSEISEEGQEDEESSEEDQEGAEEDEESSEEVRGPREPLTLLLTSVKPDGDPNDPEVEWRYDITWDDELPIHGGRKLNPQISTYKACPDTERSEDAYEHHYTRPGLSTEDRMWPSKLYKDQLNGELLPLELDDETKKQEEETYKTDLATVKSRCALAFGGESRSVYEKPDVVLPPSVPTPSTTEVSGPSTADPSAPSVAEVPAPSTADVPALSTARVASTAEVPIRSMSNKTLSTAEVNAPSTTDMPASSTIGGPAPTTGGWLSTLASGVGIGKAATATADKTTGVLSFFGKCPETLQIARPTMTSLGSHLGTASRVLRYSQYASNAIWGSQKRPESTETKSKGWFSTIGSTVGTALTGLGDVKLALAAASYFGLDPGVQEALGPTLGTATSVLGMFGTACSLHSGASYLYSLATSDLPTWFAGSNDTKQEARSVQSKKPRFSASEKAQLYKLAQKLAEEGKILRTDTTATTDPTLRFAHSPAFTSAPSGTDIQERAGTQLTGQSVSSPKKVRDKGTKPTSRVTSGMVTKTDPERLTTKTSNAVSPSSTRVGSSYNMSTSQSPTYKPQTQSIKPLPKEKSIPDTGTGRTEPPMWTLRGVGTQSYPESEAQKAMAFTPPSTDKTQSRGPSSTQNLYNTSASQSLMSTHKPTTQSLNPLSKKILKKGAPRTELSIPESGEDESRFSPPTKARRAKAVSFMLPTTDKEVSSIKPSCAPFLSGMRIKDIPTDFRVKWGKDGPTFWRPNTNIVQPV